VPWRETIDSHNDKDRHRQRDRGSFRPYATLILDLLESVYHAVLASMNLLSVDSGRVSQQAIPVVYGTIRINIGFRADLIVEDLVIVEIKSVEVLAPVNKK
jgi:GxxExxY protein